MPDEVLLDRKWRTYTAAAGNETNLLASLQDDKKAADLRAELWAQRYTIQSIIRNHLRLNEHDTCKVLPQNCWIQGGFNICVMVETISRSTTRYIVFRCPLKHGLAERQLIEEKVNCEVATYIWMQENCPEIKIPMLYAFGFTNCHVRFYS